MNTYSDSEGNRYTQSQIDSRIRKAKAQLLENQINDFGYNFCEQCGKSRGDYLDCSHDISVKKAKDEGNTELCWKVGNMTVLCRTCHQAKDKLHVQF